ncbi:MAG: (2Fe-2S)-binding protein [Calditrichaceae bacterium]|nr:(2Fe-2S)-binding protein [Calditrichaceae bacterium]
MKSKDISRRKFIKNLGGGVIGAGVVLSHKPLKAEDQPAKDENKQNLARLNLTVNGKKVSLDIEPQTTLAQMLREKLKLTGTKVVCNHGECGACTVLLDGRPVYSCHMLALDAEGKEVITIEGLMEGEKLHPIQEAFVKHDGLQCGFCTPGQIMAAQGILNKNPRPDRLEIMEGMSGNICRCAAYPKILESAIAAAEKAE